MAKFCYGPSKGSAKPMQGKPAPSTQKRQGMPSKKEPQPVYKPTKGR